MIKYFSSILIFALFVSCNSDTEPQSSNIKLPAGFKIEDYSSNVSTARSMVLSPNGVFYFGSRNAGKFYVLLDNNNDF